MDEMDCMDEMDEMDEMDTGPLTPTKTRRLHLSPPLRD